MNRRQFLGCASVVATPSLGGCLTDASAPGSDGDESDDADGPSDWTDAYPPSTDDLEEYEPAATARSTAIGRADELESYYEPPPEVRIWNAAGHSTVDLEVFDTVSGDTVLAASYEIPADEELRLTVWDPSAYVYEVAVPGMNLEQVYGLPCVRFSCNEDVTRIGLFEDALRSNASTTAVGCGWYCAELPDVDPDYPFGNHTRSDA